MDGQQQSQQDDQRSNRQARQVRFNDNSEEISVEYPAPGSDNDIWYSRNEVQNFIAVQRADILRIAHAFSVAPGAIVSDEERIGMLGLEGFITPAVAQRVNQIRETHRNVVLAEQHRQNSLNINDWVVLGRISEHFSSPTRETAYQLALRFANMNID